MRDRRHPDGVLSEVDRTGGTATILDARETEGNR